MSNVQVSEPIRFDPNNHLSGFSSQVISERSGRTYNVSIAFDVKNDVNRCSMNVSSDFDVDGETYNLYRGSLIRKAIAAIAMQDMNEIREIAARCYDSDGGEVI